MFEKNKKLSCKEVALKVLLEVENGNYIQDSLNKILNNYPLSLKDRSLVTELCYGSIRWQLTIDWIIKKYSKYPLNKIPKKNF
jgi:16S rRNA (cytosine967-C5)-methyltransferase